MFNRISTFRHTIHSRNSKFVNDCEQRGQKVNKKSVHINKHKQINKINNLSKIWIKDKTKQSNSTVRIFALTALTFDIPKLNKLIHWATNTREKNKPNQNRDDVGKWIETGKKKKKKKTQRIDNKT